MSRKPNKERRKEPDAGPRRAGHPVLRRMGQDTCPWATQVAKALPLSNVTEKLVGEPGWVGKREEMAAW
jgi:hypothetical protein